MRKVYLFCSFLILIFFPLNIKAYCSDERINKYTSLANNINYFYTHEEIDGRVTFDISFNNLNNSFYIENVKDGKYYLKDDILTLSNFKSGKEYIFNIYPSNNCIDTKVRTIYIKMPNYNKYYVDDLCKGIEEYELCQKWQEVNLNKEEFTNKIIEYKKSLIKTEVEENENRTLLDNVRYYLVKIYVDYYFIFLPMTIISLVIIIYKMDQKDRIL